MPGLPSPRWYPKRDKRNPYGAIDVGLRAEYGIDE
jgi:hypothetical protein